VDETRWGSLTQHPDQFDKHYYATVGELRNPASVPMRVSLAFHKGVRFATLRKAP
jgi:hypothetical protein